MLFCYLCKFHNSYFLLYMFICLIYFICISCNTNILAHAVVELVGERGQQVFACFDFQKSSPRAQDAIAWQVARPFFQSTVIQSGFSCGWSGVSALYLAATLTMLQDVHAFMYLSLATTYKFSMSPAEYKYINI